MNIAVTGANGFIGSNLCKLLSAEHKILAISRSNNNILGIENLFFLQCDFESISKFKSNISDFQPEILIHCAWIGGNSFKDINSLIQFDNLNYSYEVLKMFYECGISKFIGIGSGSEYGEHYTAANEEDYVKPYSLYGCTKRYFKDFSSKFCQINNLNYSWIIPMYTYGYNDIKTRFIPTVINKCLNQEDIELNSCDSMVDYLFIDDFCLGMKSIIDSNLNGCFNISSNQVYKTKIISEMIAEFTGYKKTIFFNEKKDRINFHNYFHSSSEKLQKFTNWKPHTNLHDGLLKTIEYHKKNKIS